MYIRRTVFIMDLRARIWHATDAILWGVIHIAQAGIEPWVDQEQSTTCSICVSSSAFSPFSGLHSSIMVATNIYNWLKGNLTICVGRGKGMLLQDIWICKVQPFVTGPTIPCFAKLDRWRWRNADSHYSYRLHCPDKSSFTKPRPLRSNFVDNLRGFQSQNKLKKVAHTFADLRIP